MSDTKKKRYALSISFYIDAVDDQQAFDIANEIRSHEREEHDNDCSVEYLKAAPFGLLERKDLTYECKKSRVDKMTASL